MQAAFIVMSILGCDDSGDACATVAQVPAQWQTIADCDAESEKHLATYANVSFPVVAAVCQTAETTALADPTEDAAQHDIGNSSVAPMSQAAQSSIAARAMDIMRAAIPSTKSLWQTAAYPIHVVTDSYSWVARKMTD